MAKQKSAEKYNWGRLIIMIVAAIALVGIIIITAMAFMKNRNADKRLSAQSFINSIASYEIVEMTTESKTVTSVDKCLDAQGELMAYAVTGCADGFAGKVSVRCYFDPDGETLIGIQVIDHIENDKKGYKNTQSQNYGDEIADSTYVQRFEYAKMPVWLYDGSVEGEERPAEAGTRIDTLSGATVSSQAVVKAVNAAYTYFTESVL